LIPLHYARKASGEYHDPISFKPFNEHSHIVAIATTGNVFLAESVKGGVDLLNDVRFKKYVPSLPVRSAVDFLAFLREDVITLQNPHGLPPASVSTVKVSAAQKDQVVAPAKPPPPGPVSAVKKEVTPCMSPCLPPSSLLISLDQGTYLRTRLGPLALH
jgi:peptidyl-prolyl cis-trans isomerase-like protein 2